jgi:hypothetical protein
VVACDGGGGPLGHPRIFINVDKPQVNCCTYCGLPFVSYNLLGAVCGMSAIRVCYDSSDTNLSATGTQQSQEVPRIPPIDPLPIGACWRPCRGARVTKSDRRASWPAIKAEKLMIHMRVRFGRVCRLTAVHIHKGHPEEFSSNRCIESAPPTTQSLGRHIKAEILDMIVMQGYLCKLSSYISDLTVN